MRKAKIFVTLRDGILDPAGAAVRGSLRRLGFDEAQDARIGKYIELSLSDGDGSEGAEGAEGADIEARVRAMCEKLLANPVTEDFRFEIEGEDGP